MRITRENHCLFLLDEPDTHLNPIWKLRYFDDIEGVLSTEGSDGMIQGERDYDPDKGGVAIIIDVTSVRGYGAEGPIEQSA